MNSRRLILAAVVLWLAACQPAEDDDPVEQAAAGSLSGGAFYFERIAMPEDASLEVVLLDSSGERERVLVRRVLDQVGNPPYTFEIDYDPVGVDPDDEHELWLTLYMPDGTARFSAEAVVDLRHTEVPQVRLVAIDPPADAIVETEVEPEPETDADTDDSEPATDDADSAEEAAEALTLTSDWQCGDTPVEAIHDDPDVLLTLPWTDAVLSPEPAASGARFAADGIEFWSRGSDQARLDVPGQEAVECRPTDRASPWAEARDAGVFFRASGNEPGWLLELYDADSPVLRLLLDQGSRELYFDTVIEDPDGDGYIAESPGNQAGIILIRETCIDSMVGWPFPYRVEMLLNDRELTACGRFL